MNKSELFSTNSIVFSIKIKT